MGEIQHIVSLVVFNLFFLIFIIAIVIFVKQYQAKKKEHLDMLARQHIEHQKEILTTQFEIQTQTMQHIGREIHDNIGQQLTLSSIYLQQLAHENKAPNITENIENISKIINNTLTELRELSKTLTDNLIENNNIAKLLEQECKKVNQLNFCKVVFNANDKKLKLPYKSKSIIFRIVQEFLQNSIKYSKCKNIDITMESSLEKLILILKDDGIGFDINNIKSNGIGLNNMKNRTEMIGGVFHLDSKIDTGTTLNIEIPLN